DAGLEIRRLVLGAEVAVEVALAGALAAPVGEGIRDRDERDLAGGDFQLAGIDLPDDPLDRLRPASLVAVHRTKHDELRTGCGSLVRNQFERQGTRGNAWVHGGDYPRRSPRVTRRRAMRSRTPRGASSPMR